MRSVIVLKTFYPDGIDFPFLLCLHESHLDPSRKKNRMEGNDWQPNSEDEHKERNPK